MLTERRGHEPLAIVGIGCRLPGGVDSPESYWDLLCSGTDATRVVPESRWNAARFHDPHPGKVGKMVTRRGGFLDRGRPVRPAVLRHLAARGPPARPAAAPAAAGHLGGAGGRRHPRRLAGRHRGRRVHRRLHPRLPTPAEPGPHQSLPVQDPLVHRNDDDDAGEPHLVRLRLPRAEHDDRHRLLEFARRGSPGGAEHLERRMRPSPSPAA